MPGQAARLALALAAAAAAVLSSAAGGLGCNPKDSSLFCYNLANFRKNGQAGFSFANGALDLELHGPGTSCVFPASPSDLSSLSSPSFLANISFSFVPYKGPRGYGGSPSFSSSISPEGAGVGPSSPQSSPSASLAPAALGAQQSLSKATHVAASSSAAGAQDYKAVNPGFAFVLTGTQQTDCYGMSFGYSGASSFSQSVAVFFKATPVSCVAIAFNASDPGDECQYADSVVLLDPSQAFNGLSIYNTWILYDGVAKQLLVYLSNTTIRPSTPILVSPVDLLGTLGTPLVYPGFTGKSDALYYTWPPSSNEKHLVYSLSIEAIDGAVPAFPLTPPPPGCIFLPSSITCAGFGGSTAFNLSTGAGVSTPDFALDLEHYLFLGGCAFSPSPLLLPSSSFSSHFSFSFQQNRQTQSPGFAPVLTPLQQFDCYGIGNGGGMQAAGTKPLTGRNLLAPTAAPSPAAQTISVWFKDYPASCVAVAVDSSDVGDYCLQAASSVILNESQSFTNLTVFRTWVEYDAASQQLHVYLTSGTVKPPTPILVASVDLLATLGNSSVYPGFTGHANFYYDYQANGLKSEENHMIYSFSMDSVREGQLPVLSVAPRPPTCHYTPSSITCVGFGGSASFSLYGLATVTFPNYSLDLQRYDVGCAFSHLPLDLFSSSSSNSSSANFSFSLKENSPASVGLPGFSFLLSNARQTYCIWGDQPWCCLPSCASQSSPFTTPQPPSLRIPRRLHRLHLHLPLRLSHLLPSFPSASASFPSSFPLLPLPPYYSPPPTTS